MTTESKQGVVVDREVRTDEDGKRHIKLVCELPDLSGRAASLGEKPKEPKRT